MNRTILIIAVGMAILILGAIVAARFFFVAEPVAPSGSNASGTIGIDDPNYVPYPSGGSQGSVPNASPEATAVQTAFTAWLASDNPDNIRMGNTVVSGEYALQLWTGDITGGQALLKYDTAQGQWVVVELGGGAWTAESLVELEGVPTDVAAALVAGASRR